MTITTIPTTCRAARIVNPGPDFQLVVDEAYPTPKAGPGQILVEIKASGVCQSDFHAANGDWGHPPNEGVNCMGHEGAGVVAAVGDGVAGWRVGDKAGCPPLYTACQACEFCVAGAESLCAQRELLAVHRNGTFCQYVAFDAKFAVPLPANVSYEQAAPFMCSGGTAFAALKAAGLKIGSFLCVVGAAGGVGHMVVQFAKAMGLHVIAIDVGADKAAGTLECGAEAFIDVTKEKDLPGKVKSHTGGLGAHGVIVTAGNGKAYEAAAPLLRPLGVLVAVGLPAAGTAIAGADPALVCFSGLTIRGILINSRADMEKAITYLESGQVKEHIQVFPFAHLPQAVSDVGASRTQGRAVVVYDQ
ncbi:hypothetical protein Q8F55_005472 [Vanrija albida]|uniref:Enoyl reductase (ER) domain-containing protein n=1 Tax=Vanrija albida TaxID=181172 RepID=A0ABR3Q1Q7_9TREE